MFHMSWNILHWSINYSSLVDWTINKINFLSHIWWFMLSLMFIVYSFIFQINYFLDIWFYCFNFYLQRMIRGITTLLTFKVFSPFDNLYFDIRLSGKTMMFMLRINVLTSLWLCLASNFINNVTCCKEVYIFP